jgi:hypothetical protein
LILIVIEGIPEGTMIGIEIGIMSTETPKCGSPAIEVRHMAVVWAIIMFIITTNTIMKVIGTPGTFGRDTRRGIRTDSAKEDTIVRTEGSFSDTAIPLAVPAFTFQLEDSGNDGRLPSPGD